MQLTLSPALPDDADNQKEDPDYAMSSESDQNENEPETEVSSSGMDTGSQSLMRLVQYVKTQRFLW